MSGARRYVVEVHDVSPSDPATADRLLDCVPPEAAARAALLIVPDWGGRLAQSSRLEAAPALRRAGATHVLHGYTHSLGYSLIDAIWFGTENEAEFARLNAGDAARRVEMALDLFRQALGVSPTWFCAPRWQTSVAAREAVRRAGLGLLDRDEMITRQGSHVPAPVVWFDDGVRLAARSIGRLHRARRLAAALHRGTVMRVALHPRDLASPAAQRELRALFQRLDGEGWAPSSLDDVAEGA